MIRVYYLTRDCGDGTTTVDFFTDREFAEDLLENDEDFYTNDSLDSFAVHDLGTIDIRERDQ